MNLIKFFTLIVFVSLFFSCEVKNKELPPPQIFMIGDSTMANKKESDWPEHGWGQVLPNYLSQDVVVENHARNGRSSKSFFDEGLWDPVKSKIKTGDYVIIQFGHNDQKPDSLRHTDAFTTYKTYFTQYIDDTEERGGIPILCTSIVRRKFDDSGQLLDTHGDYLTAVRELATELDVHLLDLEISTRKAVKDAGVEDSKKFYLHLAEKEHPNYPDGVEDNTHLSPLGAETVVELALTEMEKKGIWIAKWKINN